MIGIMQTVLRNRSLNAGANLYMFTVTGRTAGTVATSGTMVFSATEDLTVTGTGDVTIVSVTRANDPTADIRSHSVVFNCANEGSGKVVIVGKSKVISLGNHNGTLNPSANFYAGTNATAPILAWNLDDMPSGLQKINSGIQLVTILPATGLNALPNSLLYFFINGNNIVWKYTGSLPDGLLHIDIRANNTVWQHDGALPSKAAWLVFTGNSTNWTGTTFGSAANPPNMTTFNFTSFRNPSDNMTYDELLLMLDGLINRVGTLPPTVIIREQIAANVTAIAAASPDVAGTDPEKCKYYINLIKSTKGVTTFTLNTTNI